MPLLGPGETGVARLWRGWGWGGGGVRACVNPVNPGEGLFVVCCHNVSSIAFWAWHMYSHKGIRRIRNAFIMLYKIAPNHALCSRDIACGRWVPGPFLNDMSARSIFNMTAGGSSHTFNWVSGVIYRFLVQLYEDYTSVHIKRYMMQSTLPCVCKDKAYV